MQIGDGFSYPMDISKWISGDYPILVRCGNVSQRMAGRPLDILRTKRATRVMMSSNKQQQNKWKNLRDPEVKAYFGVKGNDLSSSANEPHDLEAFTSLRARSRYLYAKS